MTETKHTPAGPRKCAQCGAELPPDVAPELCPRCLLKTGLAAEGAGPRDPAPSAALSGSGDFLQTGQVFGHYRIVQPLGGGGMGTVFEAEDLDTGRRVALKVLSHSLDSPEARERFFREGRLAAAINHPNSVYVFGTEEIGGTPAIAMELVSGGTLQDRVKQRGPLPAAEAVDAALQIVAGLEAAHRVGILHRDVKPSNCFVDPDGTVKIGDFGLSISTALRTEPALTSTGSFLGTPAFCSPEQLRGEELSARSDIYALGATLYFLLTGRTPFQAQNVVALIATVLEQTAPSPAKLQPGIPRGLAKAVSRCLEKQPADRFKSYDELRRALAPYGSIAPAPATLGRRFLAAALDMTFISVALQLVLLADAGDPFDLLELLSKGSPQAMLLIGAGLLSYVMYFALWEGLRGATPGKFICRLRVAGPDQNPPGLRRALGRALIFTIPPLLPIWILCAGDIRRYMSEPQTTQLLMALPQYVMMALLFVTARRANGLAALHDLATRTRVIIRLPWATRPVPALAESRPSTVERTTQLGPYHVLESLGTTPGGDWLLGYDLRLLRHVWIRVVPPGTPPVPLHLRNIGRIGRLRWLTGRRTADESWDAFEAPRGQPLLRKIERQPQPWAQVRFWLQDLAAELNAALKDGTFPQGLALERVWISEEGRAKILDFGPPGPESAPAPVPGQPPLVPDRAVPVFLRAVADAALEGGARSSNAPATEGLQARVPLHAREFVKHLPQMADAGAVLEALRFLLHRPALVTRRRRTAVIVGCVAVPLVMSVLVITSLGMVEKWRRNNPGLMELNGLLSSHRALNWFAKRPNTPTDRQFAIYVAAHYAGVITNQAVWSGPFALTMISGKDRKFAETSVAEHPAPTREEIANADAALKGLATAAATPPAAGHLAGIIFPGMLALYVGLPALIAALLFRGGVVLRLAGVVFVRRNGQLASRLRVFWRALVAWLPVIVGLALWISMSNKHSAYTQALGWLIAGGLALISAALPERGLPDRLAGTWPVPR